MQQESGIMGREGWISSARDDLLENNRIQNTSEQEVLDDVQEKMGDRELTDEDLWGLFGLDIAGEVGSEDLLPFDSRAQEILTPHPDIVAFAHDAHALDEVYEDMRDQCSQGDLHTLDSVFRLIREKREEDQTRVSAMIDESGAGAERDVFMPVFDRFADRFTPFLDGDWSNQDVVRAAQGIVYDELGIYGDEVVDDLYPDRYKINPESSDWAWRQICKRVVEAQIGRYVRGESTFIRQAGRQDVQLESQEPTQGSNILPQLQAEMTDRLDREFDASYSTSTERYGRSSRTHSIEDRFRALGDGLVMGHGVIEPGYTPGQLEEMFSEQQSGLRPLEARYTSEEAQNMYHDAMVIGYISRILENSLPSNLDAESILSGQIALEAIRDDSLRRDFQDWLQRSDILSSDDIIPMAVMLGDRSLIDSEQEISEGSFDSLNNEVEELRMERLLQHTRERLYEGQYGLVHPEHISAPIAVEPIQASEIGDQLDGAKKYVEVVKAAASKEASAILLQTIVLDMGIDTREAGEVLEQIDWNYYDPLGCYVSIDKLKRFEQKIDDITDDQKRLLGMLAAANIMTTPIGQIHERATRIAELYDNGSLRPSDVIDVHNIAYEVVDGVNQAHNSWSPGDPPLPFYDIIGYLSTHANIDSNPLEEELIYQHSFPSRLERTNYYGSGRQNFRKGHPPLYSMQNTMDMGDIRQGAATRAEELFDVLRRYAELQVVLSGQHLSWQDYILSCPKKYKRWKKGRGSGDPEGFIRALDLDGDISSVESFLDEALDVNNVIEELGRLEAVIDWGTRTLELLDEIELDLGMFKLQAKKERGEVIKQVRKQFSVRLGEVEPDLYSYFTDEVSNADLTNEEEQETIERTVRRIVGNVASEVEESIQSKTHDLTQGPAQIDFIDESVDSDGFVIIPDQRHSQGDGVPIGLLGGMTAWYGPRGNYLGGLVVGVDALAAHHTDYLTADLPEIWELEVSESSKFSLFSLDEELRTLREGLNRIVQEPTYIYRERLGQLLDRTWTGREQRVRAQQREIEELAQGLPHSLIE
jgi:hypothetical protein